MEVQELLTRIYDSNVEHFTDRDAYPECDCAIHITVNTMFNYLDA